MAVKKFGVCFTRRLTNCTVRILLVGSQKGQRHGLAIELHHSGGIQILILGYEFIFLLHQFHNGRREAAGGDLQIPEHQAAVMLFQIFAIGGLQQGSIYLVDQFLQLGTDLVHIVVLSVVELVLGIDGVADISKLLHRACSLHLLFEGIICLDLTVCIGSGFHCLQGTGGRCRQLLHIRTAVRHLTEFHIDTSFRFLMKELCFYYSTVPSALQAPLG